MRQQHGAGRCNPPCALQQVPICRDLGLAAPARPPDLTRQPPLPPAGAALGPVARAQLPTSDPQRLVDNLKFIRSEVLPDENMKIWMVMKVRALRPLHRLRALAQLPAGAAAGCWAAMHRAVAGMLLAASCRPRPSRPCAPPALTRPPLPHPCLRQWHAYGHGIRNLANAAAQGADGIALYYNSEAAEVLDAANSTGGAAPPMLRILPAKYTQALEALQLNMGIQARGGGGVRWVGGWGAGDVCNGLSQASKPVELRCLLPQASPAPCSAPCSPHALPSPPLPALPPQELLGPGNQENLTLAAEDSGKTMPVHVYLYNHYADPWGYNFTTSAELQARGLGGGQIEK